MKKFALGFIVGLVIARGSAWLSLLAAVCLALAIFAGSANAQDLGYQINLGAAAVANNPQGTQDVNLHFGGSFRFNKLSLNGDGFLDPSKNNPKRPTFGAASAAYQAFESKLLKVGVGGFGAKYGNEVFGGGELRLTVGNLETFGRYGSKNFAQGEGAFWVINTERLGVGPFYSVTRLEQLQTVQQFGVRLALKK